MYGFPKLNLSTNVNQCGLLDYSHAWFFAVLFIFRNWIWRCCDCFIPSVGYKNRQSSWSARGLLSSKLAQSNESYGNRVCVCSCHILPGVLSWIPLLCALKFLQHVQVWTSIIKYRVLWLVNMHVSCILISRLNCLIKFPKFFSRFPTLTV